MQQMPFEIIVAKGEIALKEKFLLRPIFPPLYSILILLFKENFHFVDTIFFSKWAAADLLYMGRKENKILRP